MRDASAGMARRGRAVSPQSGMRVSGYSVTPSAYGRNPVAVVALVMGVASMLVLVIPNVGKYIALPMSIATLLCGIIGMRKARRAGGRNGDLSVGGMAMGVISMILTGIMLLMANGYIGMSPDAQPTLSGASTSGDDDLAKIAMAQDANDAWREIVGYSWGTGETRTDSSEVITIHIDGTFEAWTGAGDANSAWKGSYRILLGKEALDAAPSAATDKMRDEVLASRTFRESRVVLLEMTVVDPDDSRNGTILRMIGHYVPEEGGGTLYMRDAESPSADPSVLHRLDNKEAGL